jgi:glucose uptake protein GlcU
MACQANEVLTEIGCIPNDPVGFVQKFYGVGLGLIGGVALLFIIYGGYIVLTSQGNPMRLNNGKSYIMYSLIGLLIAVFGYVIIQVMVIDILKIPGFS